ncbi:hypothetical protein HOK51_02440 [Candidatus Woesearchaeota archaeon]|jgi:hypothetical protein|nr:hypothetical protein [Candidatus Woesearchaeota archaeon]MBT7368866.1 hypothetical protein [Candidatus Woesearchaeota archaeon]
MGYNYPDKKQNKKKSNELGETKKMIDFGVLETLVKGVEKIKPGEVQVIKGEVGELPDGNEVRTNKTYKTYIGELDSTMELNYKWFYDYYGDEEYGIIDLKLYGTESEPVELHAKQNKSGAYVMLRTIAAELNHKASGAVYKTKTELEKLEELEGLVNTA